MFLLPVQLPQQEEQSQVPGGALSPAGEGSLLAQAWAGAALESGLLRGQQTAERPFTDPPTQPVPGADMVCSEERGFLEDVTENAVWPDSCS